MKNEESKFSMHVGPEVFSIAVASFFTYLLGRKMGKRKTVKSLKRMNQQ